MTPPRHVLNVGLGLFLLVALTEHGTAGNGDAWIAKIRKDHPRPFRGVFPDRPASVARRATRRFKASRCRTARHATPAGPIARIHLMIPACLEVGNC